MSFVLTESQRAQFDRDGYLSSSASSTAWRSAGSAGSPGRPRARAEAASRRDGAGGTIRLSVRNELGEDIYSAFVRCRRIVETMERLLDGEVYHYHHKMILKEPRIGGAWEWHQDYGYWYDNGCLFPDLASCMIAVDRATRANGCLQVLKGSHRMGRINHGPIGDQTGADPERVSEALEPAGAGLLRARAWRCHLLPLQPAAPLRPQRQRRAALGLDLLLQRRAERPLQGIPAPALQLPGKMARRAGSMRLAEAHWEALGDRGEPPDVAEIAHPFANRLDKPEV